MDGTMTVAQSLRHARHDFLNELQLIKMNLDLGRTQQVQAIIRSHAEAAVQAERLSSLSVPETEEWLLTANWRFPALRFQMECSADKAPAQLDGAFARTLEELMQSINERLEQEDELFCRIGFTNDPSSFLMTVQLNGDWLSIELPETAAIKGRKECVKSKTSFAFSAQMEG